MMQPVDNLPFGEIINNIRLMLVSAPIIDTGEWQAIQGAPQSKMAEAEDISFSIHVPRSIRELEVIINPNLPWAEDHFLERVSGIPHNPPPSSEWWPFATKNNDFFKRNEKFSHTYPERLWPVHARHHQYPMNGIRFAYGDLGDVVKLLKERPHTRQAYIPIWFPEDGYAALSKERVPCTLGYHLLLRHGQLKIVYYIRSCDYIRHFRDDVYMTARLCQWIADQIGAVPGRLVMHISSMHVFESDVPRLRSAMKLG